MLSFVRAIPNYHEFAKQLAVRLSSKLGLPSALSWVDAWPEAKASQRFFKAQLTMMVLFILGCFIGCNGAVSSVKPLQPSGTSLRITSSAIPIGVAQTSYEAMLSASGGLPPYTWSISIGKLPPGLGLDPNTGAIAGKPMATGSFDFTTSVHDLKNTFVAAGLTLKISTLPAAPIRVNPPPPVGGGPTPPTSGPTPPPVNGPPAPPANGPPAPSVLAITSPSNGSKVFGSTVHVSATATNSPSPVAAVQFFLDGSPLGPSLTHGPYEITWDTTQVADGLQRLSAIATDVKGDTATQAAIAVTVTNTSWDPSVLGAAWAADFSSIAAKEINVKMDSRLKVKAVGDGVADDSAAVRAAILLASTAGGGVVFFPTGDYRILAPSGPTAGNPLVIPSRVILRGVTPATSRIFVNDPHSASQTNWTGTWGGIDFQNTSMSGMTDLGVYAVTSSNSPCALIWNWGTTKAAELFFNNLDVHLENCRSFWIESTDKLLIQNSRFDSTSTQNGPIYVAWNSDVTFVNNTINYDFGRVQLHNSTNLLMQGNKLTRDAQSKAADNHSAIESGGVELSFGRNIRMLNNVIQTLNAVPDESGDGEAIMTQESNLENVLDAGSATSTSPTTLTDTNARWGSVTASRLAKFSEVVAILTGPAAGQWRAISDVNTKTKTLTLNQPWNPVPEPGTLYSIFAWTLMNANIQGNTLVDNPNGIVLWEGCYDCTIQENKLINSRGIILRTADTSVDQTQYPEGRRVHYVAINNKILNNTVTNTSGIRPAYIVLDTEAFSADSYSGLGMFNIQVGGNVIKPFPSNPNQSYDPSKNELSREGFFPCFLFGPATVKPSVNTVFQGIHFWNNSQGAPVNYSAGYLGYATQSCVTPTAP